MPDRERIYLDTSVILAAFLGPKDRHHQAACEVLSAAQAGDFTPVVSALVPAEAVGAATVRSRDGVGPAECRREQLKARAFVEGLAGLYVELSESDGLRATELSREHNLSGADALHLAAAMRHCTTMFACDNGLLKVAGMVDPLQVLYPAWNRPQLDFVDPNG